MTEERERREGVVPPPAAQYVRTSPIRIRRSPLSNSHVQSAKAIAEDIAHLCCVPDDWRLQISDLTAWPFPTFCAKARDNPTHCGFSIRNNAINLASSYD